MTNLNKLGISLITQISRTWRITIDGAIPNSPAVIAFWHGYMLPVWKFFSDKNPSALISQSKDGEILAAILEKWNYKLVRGSSSTGGKEALEQLIELAKSGYSLITPDGPRGPQRKLKAGAVIAAQLSQSPLALCQVNIKSKYTFKKSWDFFQFPLPFSKITLSFSAPEVIDINSTREMISSKILQCENKLNNIN
ncbi:MAG: lysophospholipid acyltransferase family protein [bacterium]